jgi:hypothetical protein
LDSDDEKTSDLGYESFEDTDEKARKNVHHFEIHADSNSVVWERIETEEDEIAIEQGKN